MKLDAPPPKNILEFAHGHVWTLAVTSQGPGSCAARVVLQMYFHQNTGEKNMHPKLYTRELLTEKMEFDCRYYLDFVSEREKVKKKKIRFSSFLYGNVSIFFYRTLERTTTR